MYTHIHTYTHSDNDSDNDSDSDSFTIDESAPNPTPHQGNDAFRCISVQHVSVSTLGTKFSQQPTEAKQQTQRNDKDDDHGGLSYLDDKDKNTTLVMCANNTTFEKNGHLSQNG